MENNYSYEIVENGYYILLPNGQRWMEQLEPNIPDPTKSYEENAIAQIEELKEMENMAQQRQAEEQSLQQQVTDLQLALAELVEGGNV